MKTKLGKLMTMIIILCLGIPFTFLGETSAASPVEFTILHTNPIIEVAAARHTYPTRLMIFALQLAKRT